MSGSDSSWITQECSRIIARHAGREGALLPVLHEIQDAFGFVPGDCVPAIAEGLNLARAEVHGALTFYHYFRGSAAGRRVVKLCQAEACQARGGRDVTRAAEARLGLRLGETSADLQFTLDPVYCLGLCASGPAGLVDGRPVGRLTADQIERLLEDAAR